MIKKITFADAMKQAQACVTRMEEESLSLEEMIECYDKGMQAIASCKEQLAVAEQKIVIIKQKK